MKKKLSDRDLAFIKENLHTLEVFEMAAQLHCPPELVEPVVKDLLSVKSIPFAESNGTISMTAARSTADDKAPPKVNKEFYKNHRKCIHVIDPSKPIQ